MQMIVMSLLERSEKMDIIALTNFPRAAATK
jgi:hypothetical protein